MAGRKKPASVPPIPTNSLVASAVRYSGASARIYRGSQPWQSEAYRFYGIIGEARYAANYYGHSLSRAVLYAEDITDGKPTKLEPNSKASIYLDELFNGREGQEAMLKALGVHMTVAGEAYLIGRQISEQEVADLPPGADVKSEVWEIVSVMEVKVTGTKWTLNYEDGKPDIELTKDDVVIRIWNPKPGKRMEADSPFRSMLGVLGEIELLTKHIFAQGTSRLTGAGIFFMPDDMTFPAPPEQDGKPVEVSTSADGLMMVLGEAMLEPITDPDSPAAVIPICITGPADSIDKAKLLHFWSELDEKALEMRNDAIARFARGMDLPAEKVLGISSNSGSGGGTSNGVSHWGAWQIDEDTIKLHIEPMLALICNALTISYIRPLTGGNERLRFDTSTLRLRPDRSKEALDLWDRGIITTKALLREVGFEDIDRLDWNSDEFKTRLLMKTAGGSSTPEQVQEALKALGVDLGPLLNPTATPREARPDPTTQDLPQRELPEAANARVLLAACEPLVYRALERAGNRLRTASKTAPACPSFSTHEFIKTKDADYIMADAWSCADQTLAGLTNVEDTVSVLDAYCRTLLEEQVPHTRERLQHWLSLTVADAA